MNKTSVTEPKLALLTIIINELLNQLTSVLVLRLTLLLLLFYGSSSILLDIPLRIVCSLMLLLPILQTNQIMWVIICALVWWINAIDWFALDNHKILIGYWCLVCALAVSSKVTDKVLAWNGRMLIGLTFLFATAWKIMAGEYGDGSFLLYTFLSDRRVELMATFIGSISPDILQQNRLLEALLRYQPHILGSTTVSSSPQLELFTLAASYWTLIIESAVAVSFLGGGMSRLFLLRDWILILFIATTYFLLPVLGFAYILMIMGFAQCPPQNNTIKIAYICLFGLLQFARFPWNILFI
ncbi:MAG: hypothetical protein DSM107014_08460 [Gomphosphaeria aponina SAG 52.96 = DSM 107014]|uniref:Uncharacterized protein n=1 Tax=Gomphosphaeria aponina SAG 52.96 = DSM 107014 TaxID=1521640 RepID=A0A941JUZ4_9CHRO|nr:hypothetical protein [Gomphosphaeria aponina SAG 52.96 = DSM 107014]